MTPEDLLNWIANDGFAIAVSVFLLLRIEYRLKKIEELLARSL